MATKTLFDVDAFLDRQKIGPAHIKVILLLVFAMVLDGYDIQVVGWTLPPIARFMHVKPQGLTGVFVAQQFGLLVGTLLVSPLADRFGRRAILLFCITVFTLATLVTTTAQTPDFFLAIRFFSAIFFSALIPNCLALASEIAPRRMKAGVVSIVFCGYAGGHFVGSFVQAFVIEPYGWQGAFWVGGGLGVALLLLLVAFLPESVRFLAHRNGEDPRIARALQRFEPSLKFEGGERFVLQEVEKKQRAPVLSLFGGGLLTATILLWVAYVGVFTVSHLMGSWSTTVLHNMAGLSFKYIASIGAVSSTVSIIATALSGFLIDRFGPSRAMPVFFIGGAIFTAAYGLIDLHSPAFYLVAACATFFSSSGLGAMNVLGTLIYPSRIRATGISWATGAGRFGGMLGPIVGGFMLSEHWDITAIYVVTGTPLFLAAIAIAMISRSAPSLRRHGGEAAAEKPVPAAAPAPVSAVNP